MPSKERVTVMSDTDEMLEAKPMLKEEATLSSRLSPPDEVVFDYLAQKEAVPRLNPDWAVFNTAVLFGNIYISRAVYIPSIQEDVPDVNVLVVARETEEGKFERLPDLNLTIGDGEGEVFNWEDPRKWEFAVQGEQKAILGLTAVKREQGKFVPHPALVEISLKNGDLKVGTITVFDEVGKNVVPIDDKFLYRPELKSHSFHLLVKPTDEHKLAIIKEIDFSDYRQVDWMSKKVGTVARPIDIGENLRLLPIHGVRSGKGIDGNLKEFIYSVGFAIIDNDWNIQAVSAKPFWRREDFLTNLPLGQGLRGDSKKEVVYLDDWVREGKTFEFPINDGDRITVIDKKDPSQLLDQKFIRPSDTAGSYQEYPLPTGVQESFALAA